MILTDGTPSISAVVTCQSPDDEVSTVADSLIFSINVSRKYSLPLRAFSSASCKSCETVAREIISLMDQRGKAARIRNSMLGDHDLRRQCRLSRGSAGTKG